MLFCVFHAFSRCIKNRLPFLMSEYDALVKQIVYVQVHFEMGFRKFLYKTLYQLYNASHINIRTCQHNNADSIFISAACVANETAFLFLLAQIYLTTTRSTFLEHSFQSSQFDWKCDDNLGRCFDRILPELNWKCYCFHTLLAFLKLNLIDMMFSLICNRIVENNIPHLLISHFSARTLHFFITRNNKPFAP